MKHPYQPCKMKRTLPVLLLIFLTLGAYAQNNRQEINVNAGWQFANQENLVPQNALPTGDGFSFTDWQTVTLPHTAKVEPQVITEPWVGISWYKKDIEAKPEWKGRKVFIRFGAAMQKAQVWMNGKLLLTHLGGYLPFTIDITNEIRYDKTNRIVVKTDNADNPEVPPGKPIKTLDFCYYSGIYRNVSLIVTNPLHITDAVSENRTASGGIRVWYPEVSAQMATIAVATHIRNENTASQEFYVSCKLIDKNGKTVAMSISGKQLLQAGADGSVTQNLNVTNPSLWHPNHPVLYNLQVSLTANNKAVDRVITKIGIRKFEITNGHLLINDKPFLLTGTNRHQEYPYIGNALSDNAQYRDAVKIKQAGFNIVRLSHYPQSPAFMTACDELGILAIAAIPGWQFIGDETFRQRSFQDAHDLIHRDRNHACVVFWELSLNETPMPDEFMQQMVKIAAEESPESKLITCGWINKYYDVWIPARQHAKSPDYWKKYNGEIPLFTGEYGDWEYFAQDAGLNQAGYAGLKSDERTSRQLRGDGEKRLLQQATNFQEAHNDNLVNPHLGDANWLMFDYNRGYSPDIESSGIMDIFRLPKFSYYFYRSQQKPESKVGLFDGSPTLKIASYWNQSSDFSNLSVFSNCDEVALYLNNKLIEKKKADRNAISDHLPYPPFVFHLKAFETGTLKAVGVTNNKIVKEDIVVTPGQASRLKLSYDQSGKPLKADDADVVFVYATVCDAKGNPVNDSNANIRFTVNEGGTFIGQNPVKAEAGVATILLKASGKQLSLKIEAKADALLPASMILKTTK